MRGRLAVALALALAAGCSGGRGRVSQDSGDDADAADGPASVVETTPPPPKTDARDADAGDAVTDRHDAQTGTDAGADADARPGDAPDGDASSDAEAGADADAPPAPDLCSFSRGMLTVPTSPIAGTISGDSHNDVVSCGGFLPTPGPEAVYELVVDKAGLIEVRVDSDVNLAIAIRGGCADGVTELACGRSGDVPIPSTPIPPGGFDGAVPLDAGFDAAPDAPASDASTADVPPPTDLPFSGVVRARLQPGTYTIIVDELSAFDPVVDYAISVSAIVPVANAACSMPASITSGTTLTDQQMDLATSPSTACGTTPGPALFYAVGVPGGQRLTVRATPKFGDSAWMPRLGAFTACAGGSCLAQGHSSSGTTQQLDWVNNGSTWRLVVFSVAADGPVTGARFDLTVGVADQLATCGRPTAVFDGTVILNQDIKAAPPPDHPTCTSATDHALYYAAQVLPQQTLTANVVGSNSQSPFDAPALVSIRGGCASTDCQGAGNSTSFTNTSTDTEIVLIEASPAGFSTDTTFDLHVTLPPPPAAINVLAGPDLTTSESGTQATFQIKLGSPPISNVTIPLSSDTPTEGTVSPSSVVFTPDNWDQAQTVTVTGVADHVSDGDKTYTIVTAPAVSDDGRYAGLDAADVTLTNVDIDPGIKLYGTDDVVTSEWGGKATFEMRLSSAPTAAVHIPIKSSNLAEGTVSPAEIVFSPTDWSTLKTVTVTGVDDSVVDGTQTYAIQIGPATSTDHVYAGVHPPDVVAHNRDDDFGVVSGKLLSGNHTCNLNNRKQAVVDDLGTIYVVASCENGLLVFTSTDGGNTFSAGTDIPNTSGVNDVRVAAGGGGVAYVFYTSFSTGALVTITRDGGATWGAAQQIEPVDMNGTFPGNVRVAAGGDTVLLALSNVAGADSAILWRSSNAGRSFTARTIPQASVFDIFVRPDGKTVYTVTDGGFVRQSLDSGATFTDLGTLPFDASTLEFSDTQVFSASGQTLGIDDVPTPVASSADGGAADGGAIAMDASSAGFDGSPQSFFVDIGFLSDLSVDPVGDVLLLGPSPSGSLSVARKDATDTVVGEPKTLGPPAQLSIIAPLTPKIVGSVFSSGNLILFASTTAP